LLNVYAPGNEVPVGLKKNNNNNINRAACQLKIAVVINFQLQLLMEITRIFYDDRVKPDFCI